MTRAPLLAVLACCNNGAPAADGPSPTPCTAAFTGNFAETATLPACASLATGTLALHVPSATLATTLDMTFDLPATVPGDYYAETVMAWSARATQRIGNGICDYSAGNAVVPHGSFALHLAAVDDVHGTLTVVQYVLAYPSTDCGQADTETVSVTF